MDMLRGEVSNTKIYFYRFSFHNWIVENELESSEQIFKAQDLDTLDVPMSITESDLEKMGIDSIGTKRKIQNGIQKVEDYQFDIFDYK